MSIPDDRAGTKWDRAARYLKIAGVLHAHGEEGISAADLARQVGVSKRTVYRDLDAMDLDAGLAIWNDRGRFGLEAGAFLPPLALTLSEAMAFFLAARLLAKASDELDTEIIGAFVKLAQILPPVLAEQLRVTVDTYADTPRNEPFTRALRALTEAIAGHRVVEFDYAASVYDPSRGVRPTRLHPYAIEPSAQTRGLYVVGFDEARGARRTFKIERIRSISVTPAVFAKHDERVTAALQAAWDVVTDEAPVAVAVRFDPSVATRVAETRWHPSQALEAQPDGSLVWRARIAGLLEVRSWILGWGSAAEVLEPPELRAWVAGQVAAAAHRYGSRAAAGG